MCLQKAAKSSGAPGSVAQTVKTLPDSSCANAFLVRKMGSEYHIDLRLLVGQGQTIETLCELKRRLRAHLHAQEPYLRRIFIECDCCPVCPHRES